MAKRELGYPMYRDVEYELIRDLLTSVGVRNSITYLDPSTYSFQKTSPSMIHCSGCPGSGKALTVYNAVEDLKVPYAWLNCADACQTTRMALEGILASLWSFGNASSGASKGKEVRCDGTSTFLRLMLDVIEQRRWAGGLVCIVLQKSELLRQIPNLLPFFHRLPHLVPCRLVIISTSRMPLFSPMPQSLLWKVHFTNYTQEEVVEMLQLDKPSGVKEETYAQFCNLIVSMVIGICRNFSELKYLAKKQWPLYYSAVSAGQCKESESRILFTEFRTHCPKLHLLLYNHLTQEATIPTPVSILNSGKGKEMDTDCFSDEENEDEDSMFPRRAPTKLIKREGETQARSILGTGATSIPSEVQLPTRLKYLLISAYLASYNPQTSDRRFFCKAGGNHKRHTLQNVAQDKKSAHILGPKPFPLERLLHIFQYISEAADYKSSGACILTQISTLVSAGLLAQVSATGNLEAPKYRCLASLERTKAISQSIDFDLMSSLYDFGHV